MRAVFILLAVAAVGLVYLQVKWRKPYWWITALLLAFGVVNSVMWLMARH